MPVDEWDPDEEQMGRLTREERNRKVTVNDFVYKDRRKRIFRIRREGAVFQKYAWLNEKWQLLTIEVNECEARNEHLSHLNPVQANKYKGDIEWNLDEDEGYNTLMAGAAPDIR